MIEHRQGHRSVQTTSDHVAHVEAHVQVPDVVATADVLGCLVGQGRRNVTDVTTEHVHGHEHGHMSTTGTRSGQVHRHKQDTYTETHPRIRTRTRSRTHVHGHKHGDVPRTRSRAGIGTETDMGPRTGTPIWTRTVFHGRAQICRQ